MNKPPINTVGADTIRPGMNHTNPLRYKTQACTISVVPGRMISAPTISLKLNLYFEVGTFKLVPPSDEGGGEAGGREKPKVCTNYRKIVQFASLFSPSPRRGAPSSEGAAGLQAPTIDYSFFNIGSSYTGRTGSSAPTIRVVKQADKLKFEGTCVGSDRGGRGYGSMSLCGSIK